MNELQGKCKAMRYKTAYPVIIGMLILAFLISGSMAEPQQKGVVFVNSDPDGAEIYLTNLSVSSEANLTVSDTEGLTPREFFVNPGTYRLVLKKFGYTTWWPNNSIAVTPGSYTPVNISLTKINPVFGAIHLDTNPSDADLILNRVINETALPNITSQIFSKTPASVESLPPGTYFYNITRPGYYPKDGFTNVTEGDVTDLRLTLDPIPETAPVTFRSEPTSADVFIWKLKDLPASAEEDKSIAEIESSLEGFTGTYEEATAKVSGAIAGQIVLPDQMKFTNGAIGNTTAQQQLYPGRYLYLFFKDRYYPKIGKHTVTANTPSTVEARLRPMENYVQVYFETNVDDDSRPDLNIPKGAVISYEGRPLENRTPGWVSLPSHKIVNVTFDRMPLNLPTTVTVDTTLFEGRPSKWGQVINLERATYYIRTEHDDFCSFEPDGNIPVVAGANINFNLSGEQPAYLAHILSIDRSNEGKGIENRTYDEKEVVYQHNATLGNATLTLSSKIIQIAVTATAGKGGTVNLNGTRYYDYGTQSDPYNFTPNEYYQVKKLYQDGVEVPYAPSFNIPGNLMTRDHVLYCTFSPTRVWVIPNASEGGAIVPSEPYSVNTGSNVDLAMIPDTGYYLKKFTPVFENDDDPYMASEAASTNFSYSNLQSNLTLNAYFDKASYEVTAAADPADAGTITPSGVISASHGQVLDFTSKAYAGFKLADITDNGVSQGPVTPYTISVTGNHEIIAHFQTDVLTIAAVAGQGGKIEPNGTVNVTYGDDQCFNITALNNYFISSVEVDGSDLGNKTSPFSYCFPNVTENHSINASFKQNAYTITPSAGEGGSISPATPQTVTVGGSATFTVTANSCYNISDILIDGTSLGPQISPYTKTFENVTSDHTITAAFKIKTYTILVNQSNGGTITPAGTKGKVQVNCGSSQSFNITPDAGNALYDVIVDNSSVGPKNPYTFPNVTSNHTIEPIFVIPPEPDFGADRVRVPPRYPVTFKDYTTNNPTQWYWDFGDGQVTDVREPVHSYAETGNYTVKLTAFNAAAPKGVTVEKKDYISVTKDPIACMMAKPLGGTVPPGLTVNFTDCSLNTEEVSWGWVFGDSTAGSISKNITHTYTAPGVYQVTHQVDKPYVAKDYAYETITVLQEPVADFIAHPRSGKLPLSVQFEDKSQGFPTQWFWNFGDNTASYDQNPLHVYSTAGNYTVTLKVFSDEGTSDRVKQGYITVTPPINDWDGVISNP
ncbi:MAG: PKD domain-containing protein [Methanospirillum sp.]|uniref:PKD domain-containing protein n=1 Tax=Methanospirillum sp. TaxID=45200 RepID=UPI00237111EE|nr:PKD domain-containing protein [Methanospirillum sp.]MDD1730031.1 PKD domain-containing protein [Methanospirillum sp.]